MQGRFNGLTNILSFLNGKPRSILGIDISPTAVKILEISNNNNSLCVEHYGRESLPAHALDGYVIKDSKAIIECIKTVLSRLKTKCKQVALAMPDAAIISKIVQINASLNPLEMEELIMVEADKYIPYPIDEIHMDFAVLGPTEKNQDLIDVLLVASRAENVSNRVDLVARVGLEAEIIDVMSYAVERSAQQFVKDLPALKQDKIIAIIDLGFHHTHLFVLRGMKLIYSRDEKFGLKQFIEAIAAHYDISFVQATLAKDQEQLPEDYERQVLEPFNENFLLQIKRMLHFFYSSSQEEDVAHILLAGDLMQQPGLVVLIQEALSVPVTVVNPFTSMALSNMVDVDAINKDAPSLMVACGLALRIARDSD